MKTDKRIVSKAEYARIQSIRFVLHFISGFFVMGVIGSIVIAGFLFLLATQSKVSLHTDYSQLAVYGLMTISSMLLFFALLYVCKRKIKSLGEVIPFTRANTIDLPAPETLVRASQEPVQADHSILLRAAADTNQTPVDQLLRPVE